MHCEICSSWLVPFLYYRRTQDSRRGRHCTSSTAHAHSANHQHEILSVYSYRYLSVICVLAHSKTAIAFTVFNFDCDGSTQTVDASVTVLIGGSALCMYDICWWPRCNILYSDIHIRSILLKLSSIY